MNSRCARLLRSKARSVRGSYLCPCGQVPKLGIKQVGDPRMSRKTLKTAVVAFKVESELADFLNKLPNKSAFIRKAIAAQLGMACPLCNGAGVVPRGVHDHYAPLLGRFNSRSCDGCGHKLPLPRDPGDLDLEDRARLEQFFNGGPHLWQRCFDNAPTLHVPGSPIAPPTFTKHH